MYRQGMATTPPQTSQVDKSPYPKRRLEESQSHVCNCHRQLYTEKNIDDGIKYREIDDIIEFHNIHV